MCSLAGKQSRASAMLQAVKAMDPATLGCLGVVFMACAPILYKYGQRALAAHQGDKLAKAKLLKMQRAAKLSTTSASAAAAARASKAGPRDSKTAVSRSSSGGESTAAAGSQAAAGLPGKKGKRRSQRASSTSDTEQSDGHALTRKSKSKAGAKIKQAEVPEVVDEIVEDWDTVDPATEVEDWDAEAHIWIKTVIAPPRRALLRGFDSVPAPAVSREVRPRFRGRHAATAGGLGAAPGRGAAGGA